MLGNVPREKQRVRELIRARKATLREFLNPLSLQVTKNLELLPVFPGKRGITGESLIYFVGKPQTCEVQTLPHIQSLIERGFDVWLPKTIVADKTLRWGNVRDPIADLTMGAFSVREPSDITVSRQTIDFASIKIAIVPGVAFDEEGHRLGYGQGYYDRFIQSSVLNCPIIGLAFEFQIFPSLPNEGHDGKVNYIVTEKKIRNCS